MPIGTAKQLSENTGQINSIYIKAKDTKSTDTVAAKAKEHTIKNHQNQEDFTVIKRKTFYRLIIHTTTSNLCCSNS